MSWAAVAGAAVGVVGSALASKGQSAAAGQAAQNAAQQYSQTREDLLPWQQAGTMALSELQGRLPELTKPFGLQDFKESPAYQFNLQQGQKAIEKAAAKRGTFYAPQTLQDLGKYSQGVASNEFQNAFNNYQTNMGNVWNRLYGLSGTGQSAANQSGAFGAAATGAQNAFNTDAAAARAAGTVGAANAIQGGIGNYQNQQLLNQILAQNQRPTYGADTYGGNAAPF